jgi:hypothetical protein
MLELLIAARTACALKPQARIRPHLCRVKQLALLRKDRSL